MVRAGMGTRSKTLAAVCACVWPSIALAQSNGSKEGIGSLLQSLDEGFGAHVVGPIASVLFFDLAFWDNGT